MADVKWSNNTDFPIASSFADSSYIMGLTTSPANIKATRITFLGGNTSSSFRWVDSSYTLIAGHGAHITGGTDNVLLGRGATVNFSGCFTCTGTDASTSGSRFTNADNQAIFWKIGGFGLNTNSSGGVEGPQASFHSAMNYGAVGDFLFSASAPVATGNMVAYEVNPYVAVDTFFIKYKGATGTVHTITFPANGGTLPSLSADNTWTGKQTFSAAIYPSTMFVGAPQTNVLDVATVSIPGTISAAQLKGGIVPLAPVADNKTVTFDSATNIRTAFGATNLVNGSTFYVSLINTSSTFSINIAAGGGTLFNGVPTTIIAPGQTFELKGIFTDVSTPVLIFYGGTNLVNNHVSSVTSSVYDFRLSDANSFLSFGGSDPLQAAVIPNDSTLNLPIGWKTNVAKFGSSTVNFVPSSGVNLRSLASNTAINSLNGQATLIKIASNDFFLFGDLASSPTYVLDIISSADIATAYSVRRLRTDYTGYAAKLRRDSDNATTNVAFNALGVIDTDSTVQAGGDLATWMGASDVFVDTWYDQSGNGNDAKQSDTTAQPEIASGGALHILGSNSHTSSVYDGTKSLEAPTTSSLELNSTMSMVSVFRLDTGLGTLADKRSTSGVNPGYLWAFDGDTVVYQWNATTTDSVSADGGNYGVATSVSTTATRLGAYNLYQNLTSQGSGILTATGSSVTSDPLRIGGNAFGSGSGQDLIGYISEFILLNTVISDSDRTYIVSNQIDYFGL